MDENIKAELERLIKEGEPFDDKFIENPNTIFGGFYYSLPTPLNNLYTDWLEEIRFWTYNNYVSESKNIQLIINNLQRNIEPGLHKRLLSKLKAMQKYPEKKEEALKKGKKETQTGPIFNINNTQNQTQTQEQSQTQTQKIIQEVFLDAIKDELTGKQQKEIKAILEDHQDNIEEAKPKLIEKLADFGTNVLANVVSNIITNPIMTGLF